MATKRTVVLELKTSGVDIQQQMKKNTIAVNKTQTKFDNLSKKLTSVGKNMTTKLSVPIAGVGLAVTKMAMNFEDNFAKVSTLLTGSSKEISNYKSEVLNASSEMGISESEFANAVYESLSAGVKQGKAISFVKEQVKLAKGGFTSLTTAVDVSSTILNAYGKQADSVSKISDILITTQNLGKTTVDELASSMGRVIPTAAAYGVKLSNLSSAYAIMTAGGINTSEATTYLKGMLNELAKNGSKVSNILKKKTGKSFSELSKEGYSLGDIMGILGDSVDGDSTAFANLWSSQEAGTGALSILNAGTKKYNSTLKQMENSTGAADKAFGKVSKTTQYQFKKSLNALKNEGIKLGEVLIPIVGKMIEGINKAAKALHKMSPAGRKTILIIAGIVAAIGPVLLIIGKFISTTIKIISIIKKIKNAVLILNAVLMANPIILIIAGIVALIAVFVLLYKKNKAFRDFVLYTITALKKGFTAVGNAIKAVANAVWKVLLKIINLFIAYFKLEFAIIKAIIETLVGIVLIIINAIWKIISPFVTNVINRFKAVYTTVKTVLTNIKNFFGTIFSAIWGKINPIISKIKSAFISLASRVKSAFNSVKSSVSSIFSKLKSLAKSPINLVIKGLNKIVDGMNKVKIGKKISHIPYLAEGGIVNEATVAMIGEGNSPEAVVPLNSKGINNFASNIGANGLGGNQMINIQIQQQKVALADLNGKIIGNIILPEITKKIKLAGGNS